VRGGVSGRAGLRCLASRGRAPASSLLPGLIYAGPARPCNSDRRFHHRRGEGAPAIRDSPEPTSHGPTSPPSCSVPTFRSASGAIHASADQPPPGHPASLQHGCIFLQETLRTAGVRALCASKSARPGVTYLFSMASWG
jgi:hypothetical protein